MAGFSAASISNAVQDHILGHDLPGNGGSDKANIAYSWHNVSSLTIARASPEVAVLKNGDILVTGGLTASGTPTATTEIYNQSKAVWKPGPTMQSKRVGHTATLLNDGTVLVTGGETGAGTTPTAEILNFTSSSSASLPSMSFARAGHAAIALSSGKVLVTGGSDFRTSTWRQAELYDPSTHKWLPAGSMSSSRLFLTAQQLPGGDILAIGGDAGATSEKYSPSANSWSGLTKMNDKRFSSGSVKLGDGRILVAGGIVNGTALRSTEIFSPSTSRWTATGNMSVGRGEFSLTTILTGEVLAAGSKSNAGTTSSAELFHPSSGEWLAAESMHKSRGAQGYAQSLNGTTFEIGGWSGSSITSSVEVYSPAPVKKPQIIRPIDIVPLVQAAHGLKGNSANGLIAKLQAAQQKYDAKDFSTCINIMNAFRNQVGAFVNSGHISLVDSLILYDAYASVVTGIGGTPLPPFSVTAGMLVRALF